jgi:hypothetical protein
VTAPPGDRIGVGELGQLVERVVDRLILVGEHRLLVVLWGDMLVTIPTSLLKTSAAFFSLLLRNWVALSSARNTCPPLRRSRCPSRNGVSASRSGRFRFHARRAAAHRAQHLHVAARVQARRNQDHHLLTGKPVAGFSAGREGCRTPGP